MSYLTFAQTADTTIANTVTETTIFGTGAGTLTFPANFWVIGRTIRVEIRGDFADTGTPTSRIRVKAGATTLIDSTALTITALSGTEEWDISAIITCRTTGASGSLEAMLDFYYETTGGSSPINAFVIAGTTTTFDTTASGALDVTWEWGTASVSNTITSRIAYVEVLN